MRKRTREQFDSSSSSDGEDGIHSGIVDLDYILFIICQRSLQDLEIYIPQLHNNVSKQRAELESMKSDKSDKDSLRFVLNLERW